ncbi:MAG: DUF2939 domain-containing protein [Caulobacter sp.]|nr:DUF2939 domain-containing protein [Caulobacter sp.]
MIRTLASLAFAFVALSGCATASRYDAAGDVHSLLVAIRDNDKAAFEAHIDRGALKQSIETRLLRETARAGANDGWRAAAALLAPSLADAASEALIRPEVFRAAARQYGYTPDKPLPSRLAIGGSLKYLPDGRVCATRSKDGPCLLMFTNVEGTWKLSGFEGDLADLRGKKR